MLPFIKEAVTQLFQKPATENFPAEPVKAAPHYRGRIVFHADKCISCGMCERVCAGGAISTTSVDTEEGQLITRRFFLGSCTFCANCADFCVKHAIELSDDYDMVARDESELVVTGTYLKKKPAPKKPAAAAAEAPASTVKPRGRRPARQRPGQVRLLHPLRQEVPRRRAHRRPQGENLEARRGQVRRLRHLPRRLPEKSHHNVAGLKGLDGLSMPRGVPPPGLKGRAMETGASLRALKPTSLRTGGLSHTPLRERCFFPRRSPGKKSRIPANSARFGYDAICFAADAAKFCEAGLVARRATLAVRGGRTWVRASPPLSGGIGWRRWALPRRLWPASAGYYSRVIRSNSGRLFMRRGKTLFPRPRETMREQPETV